MQRPDFIPSILTSPQRAANRASIARADLYNQATAPEIACPFVHGSGAWGMF